MIWWVFSIPLTFEGQVNSLMSVEGRRPHKHLISIDLRSKATQLFALEYCYICATPKYFQSFQKIPLVLQASLTFHKMVQICFTRPRCQNKINVFGRRYWTWIKGQTKKYEHLCTSWMLNLLSKSHLSSKDREHTLSSIHGLHLEQQNDNPNVPRYRSRMTAWAISVSIHHKNHEDKCFIRRASHLQSFLRTS